MTPRSWLAYRTDALVTAVLVGFGLLEVWVPDYAPGVEPTPGPKLGLTAVILLCTAPVLVRRKTPLVALTLVLAGMAAQGRLTAPIEGLAELAAMLLCTFALGRYGDRTNTILGAVLAAVLLGIAGENAGDWTFSGLLLSGGYLAGLAVRRLQRESDGLRVRTRQLAQERDERARSAAADERRRIARELHDIVAHSVSTMVIQAQAGSALLADAPDRARLAFDSIESGGRQALTELRNLLGMLREVSDDEALEPQPTLDRLDEMVGNARRTGLDVDLHIDGHVVPLSPGLGLTVYRIVQEGLTNTIKHAGAGARATVRLAFHPDRLEVEISDDGAGGTVPPDSGGNGLRGIADRVEVLGGQIVIGPAEAGGFRVWALLPLRPAGPVEVTA